ncbi:MAG: fimbrillin family protein [Rikenellaceae bacterium]
MKKLLFTLLAAAAVVGCDKEDNYSADNVVKFSSEAISTRIDTSTNQWIAGDLIGITSSGFASAGFSSEFKNVKYKAASSAASTNFTVADGETQIVYPNVSQSSNVAFYAYYPQNTLESDDTLIVDVSTQNSSGLAAVDFMTASNSVDYSDNNYKDVEFTFGHKLSQVVMDISCNDDLASLDGLIATISSIETKGSYYVCDATNLGTLKGSLSDQGSVELIVPTTSSTTETVTITAILHPGVYTTPTLTFETSSKKYSVTFATTLVAGSSHTFNIALGYDLVGFTSGSTIGTWQSGGTSTLYPEIVTSN